MSPEIGGGKWSVLENGRLKLDCFIGMVAVSKLTFNGNDELTMVLDDPGKTSPPDKYMRIK